MNQKQYSKTLDKLPPLDRLITMGCNVSWPNHKAKQREDWGLDDPSGKSKEEFLMIIKRIDEKVRDLIKQYD